MKITKIYAFKILFISILTFSSCRTEREEIINPEQEQNIAANSILTNLMIQTTLYDGSEDNIIDQANCLTVILPVTVFVQDQVINVNTPNDLDTIEDLFDELGVGISSLEIDFPITVVREDYTEVVINSVSELTSIAATCNGENEFDDDIECIDFQYPLEYTLFNSITENFENITVSNDGQHYEFLTEILESDTVNLSFPVTLLMTDGSSMVINTVEALENSIEAAINSCDEDDDYDYEDDDCEDCDTQVLLEALTSCPGFIVEDFKRNNQDLEDAYIGYIFQFFGNGSLVVANDTTNFSGNWAAQGQGQGTTVIIDIPEAPIFNDVWNLDEIDSAGEEVQVELKKGEDRLDFECNSEYTASSSIQEFLEACDVHFSVVADGGATNTSGATLDFQENGVLIVLDAGGFITYEGTWEITTMNGQDAVISNVPDLDQFFEFVNNTWIFEEIDNDILHLVSEDGMNTLELECIDTVERFNTLTIEDWTPVEYLIGAFDLLYLIDGYTFNFDTDYTLEAQSDTAPTEVGDWLNSDLYTVVNLQFTEGALIDLSGVWYINDYRVDDLNRIFLKRENQNQDIEYLTFER